MYVENVVARDYSVCSTGFNLFKVESKITIEIPIHKGAHSYKIKLHTVTSLTIQWFVSEIESKYTKYK